MDFDGPAPKCSSRKAFAPPRLSLPRGRSLSRFSPVLLLFLAFVRYEGPFAGPQRGISPGHAPKIP